MANGFDVEVLLPVHNEADSVRQTIEEAYAHISRFVRVQFIVSEDGSTDGTKEILRELSQTIPMKLITDDARKGYLTAMRDGIRLLEAPYLLCLDSDGQCDPADFEEFWKRRNENEIVMGWRVNRADNRLRKLMSRAFRAPYRLLFGVRLNDPSCCYLLAPRAIAHELVDEVCELTQGFQWEFVARAHRKGITIHEVPVNHRFRASGRTQVFRYRRIPGIAISHLFSLLNIWAQTRPAAGRSRAAESLVMAKKSHAARPPGAARTDRLVDEFIRLLHGHSLLAAVAFTVACSAAILSQAVSRKLWFDELFTYYITRMPTWEQRIEATAADAQPPLTYLFTDFFHAIFGPTEVATRLPEAIGFLVFSVCLYLVVRRRLGLVFGFIALVAPSLTYAFRYSFEARPYGLLLGFAGLALLGWVFATESKRRVEGVVLLTLALAGAVGSHHYGLFQVILPIAAGEAVSTVIRRRIDWAILLAGVVGVAPFLFTYPLARASSDLLFEAVQQSTNFFARPTWASIPGFYEWLLILPYSPLLIALAIAALYVWRFGESPGSQDRSAPGFTIPMWAAAWTFLALPFIVVPFTMFSTGYFMVRYCLAAVAGVVLVVCGLAARRLGERGGAIMLLASLAAAAVGFPFLMRGAIELDRSKWAFQPPSMMGSDDLPILISDPILYLREAKYAREPERARLTFLTNREAALKTSDFIPELSLTSGAAWLPGNITDYDAFVSAHDQFWVLSNFRSDSQWHVKKLTADGWTLELRGREGPFDIYWAKASR